LRTCFFDPAVDLRGDRADDHAAAALENTLICPGGQNPIRIGVQFDHGNFSAYAAD